MKKEETYEAPEPFVHPMAIAAMKRREAARVEEAIAAAKFAAREARKIGVPEYPALLAECKRLLGKRGLIMENFDNVYTVEMNGRKGWEVIFTTVSSQAALNEFCRCDAEDDGVQYRLTSMLSTPTEDVSDWAERTLNELEVD